MADPASTTQGWTKHSALLSILSVALALRLGMIFHLRDRALEYSSDSKAYHDIAVNLVEQRRYITVVDPPHTLEKAYANRPPLTPWFLAGAYELFGPSLLYGQILVTLIGFGACYIVNLLVHALFDRNVAIWAILLAAVNPLWVLFAAVPMTESVAILLYPLVALASLYLLRYPTIRNAALMGVILGITALNKGTILAFGPIWAAWLVIVIWPRWGRGLLLVGVTAAVCTAVLVPWTVRNYQQLGRVIPVTLQAGHSMFEANNPYTEFALERVEHGQTWLNDPRIYSEAGDLSNLSPVQFDDTSRALALHFIRDHPGTFVEYALRRIRVFWSAYAHPAHKAYWYLVLPFFLAGFVLAWKHHLTMWRELALPSLLILQTMSLVILFPSMPRYRVPIEPFVLIFAAYAITRLVPRVFHRHSPVQTSES